MTELSRREVEKRAKEVERGRIEEYGLENIGWGMMVKRKFER